MISLTKAIDTLKKTILTNHQVHLSGTAKTSTLDYRDTKLVEQNLTNIWMCSALLNSTEPCKMRDLSVNSTGKCESCGTQSATRYELTVLGFTVNICPYCKGSLRDDIAKIDGPTD